jgi:hypothetical protein
MEKAATPRARRLILLYRLRMAGVLEPLTLHQIGKIMGISRAALLRDFRELDVAEEEFRKLMEDQPWKQWMSPAASAEVDEEIKTLKRLTRDGLVWLQNWVTPRDVVQ